MATQENHKPREKRLIDPLNFKQLTIIKLICEEFTIQEIADDMGLTKRTVNTERQELMNKIGTDNDVGIIVFAVKVGLYTL